MKTSAKILFLQALLLVSTLAASAVSVTFRINMSVQESLGNFVPGNGDQVDTRGSFATAPNGDWLGNVLVLTNDPVDTNIYSGTYDVTNAPGSTVQFKF